MRLLTLLTFVILFVAFACSTSNISVPWPPKQAYIRQRVDHLNFQPAKFTFRMRYLYENKWYSPGGPIFFYCGNEGPIEGFWNNSGFIFHLANKMNAMVVFAEHRYYGKSLPFSKSFHQPYIQYLSIEQTLADYAYLVKYLKEKYGWDSTPVIAFGGSYGGMLAAYMRARFPHLIAGAVSSSAPVKWLAGMGNLHRFFEEVTKDYRMVNVQCSKRIKEAYELLEQQVAKDIKVLTQLSKQLRLCHPMRSYKDFAWMLKWSRNAFVFMAMLDYPTKADFMAPLPAYPVNVSCARALGAPDAISGWFEAISVFYNNSQDLQCFDFKAQFTDCADSTGCGTGNEALAWDFQSCTEMKLYDSSESTSLDMFPSLPKSKEDIESYCKSRWGVVPSFNQLGTFFGPQIWKHTSNIVFSNGDLDPWMMGGVLEDVSPTVHAVIIHGGAHHLDLRMPDQNDPPSVTKVRQLEEKLIRSWIDQDRSFVHG